MSNPLLNALGGIRVSDDGGFGAMIAEFDRFKSTYRGDAKAEVQRLMASGQVSQAQYNELGQIATRIINTMK